MLILRCHVTSLISTLPRLRQPASHALGKAFSRAASRAAAFTSRHGMTMFSLGMIDIGAFRATSVAGFIVTGISVALFEHKLSVTE